MKRKQFIKIILSGLFIALLFVLPGCKGKNYVNTSYRYDDFDYKHGNFAYKEIVNEVNIDWLVGDVEVYRSTNDQELVINEDIDIEAEDKYHVHHLLKDGVLDIRFTKSLSILRRQFNLKRLRLYLPSTVNKVYINGVDAEINFDNVKIANVNINNISGDIDIKNSSFENIKIDNVSGEVMLFNNVIKNNEIKSVSGNIGLSYTTLPENLNIETVSAGTTIYIKKDDNLTITYLEVSGKVKSNLEYTKEDNTYIFNIKTNPYNLKTTSGKLTVLTK